MVDTDDDDDDEDDDDDMMNASHGKKSKHQTFTYFLLQSKIEDDNFTSKNLDFNSNNQDLLSSGNFNAEHDYQYQPRINKPVAF